MTDCNRERICLVRGLRLDVEREDHANHPLHLPFVGPYVAADELLHTFRRVLGALDPG